MALAKLNDQELAERALDLFRTHGYQGTSLNQIAEAAGMEKASLYYRYPGGKEAIVLAVAQHVGHWMDKNIFSPLAGTESPAERIETVAANLRKFYAEGRRACVLESLSLPDGPPELLAALGGALRQWLAAFTAISVEGGQPPASAARRAEQAVIGIEGALILGRVIGDQRLFLEAVAGLSAQLLGT